MKNILRTVIVAVFALFSNLCSALTAGDFAIISVNLNTDKLQIVTLRTIPAGSVVTFTDDAYTSAGALNPTEGTLVWTSPLASAINPGTIVTFNLPTPTTPNVNLGTVTGSSGFNLSNSGDNILAFSGSFVTSPAAADWIWAYTSNAFVTSGGTSSSTTYLPAALVGYSTATGANNNAYFANGNTAVTGTLSVTGTVATLIGLLANPAKWFSSTGTTWPTYSVTVATSGTPTTLAVTSITPASPTMNSSFNITVESRDNSGVPQNVTAATDVVLSLASGSGALGGTLTGTIAAGASSVTITGITYNTAESNVSVTATRTAGDNLTAATSSPFTVLGVATQLAFVGVPATGTTGTALTSFTVEARRADNTVDGTYTGPVTIALASGPGVVSGTLTANAVAGVATFANVNLSQAGIVTLGATSGSLAAATSTPITITAAPTLTELILPQYAPNGTTTASRLQYVCRLRLDNLLPNATYRYYSGASNTTSVGATAPGNFFAINSTAGADGYITGHSSNKSFTGTLMSGNEFTSSGRYAEFVTNGSGSYTGYFAIVLTGNAAFNAGNDVYFYVQINDGAGGTTVQNALRTTSTIRVLDVSGTVTASSAVPVAGNSFAPDEHFVFTYDNETGTGRPIYGTFTENDGISTNFTTWYTGAYDGVTGAWATYAPTTLPNGIRRVEYYTPAGNPLYTVTSSTGIWNGMSTVNPAPSTTPILLPNTTLDAASSLIVNSNINLTSSLTTAGTVMLNGGSITTNANTLTVTNTNTSAITGGSTTSYVNGNLARAQSATPGDIYFYPSGTTTAFRPVRITNAAVTGPNSFMVTYNPGRYPVSATTTPGDHIASSGYWDISRASGAATDPVNISLITDNAATTGITNIATVAVGHFNSGTNTWDNLGNNAGNTAYNGSGAEVTTTNVTSFSPFTFIAGGAGNPLPVVLRSFTLQSAGNRMQKLAWSITAGSDINDLIIERSADGRSFTSIAEYMDATRFDGSFTDEAPAGTDHLYYRLKMQGANDVVSYSNTLSASFTAGDQLTLYPNPAHGLANLTWTDDSVPVAISIANELGQQVYSHTFEGTRNALINTAGFASGTYFILCRQGTKVTKLTLSVIR